MAGNVEHQLITRIIAEGSAGFQTAQKLKLTDELFFVTECKEVFNYLYTHYFQQQTYGLIPSWDLIMQRFPGFPWTASPDEIPTLIEHVRNQKIRYDVQILASELQSLAQYDPREAIAKLREAAMSLSTQHEVTEDVLLANAFEPLYREYQLVASQGITGIPWPWDVVNQETQGMHPGDFIVLFGRPKSMKTFVGLYIGTCAYQHYNRRVLVMSMEMKPLRLMRRVACIAARVDYGRFVNGRLDQYDMNKVFSWLQYLQKEEEHFQENGHRASLLVTGRTKGRGSTGIASLRAKIEEFKPDLVIVDGVYLLHDDRGKQRTVDWKSIAHISQDMKETADVYSIPIIGITQAHRGGQKKGEAPKDADLEDIAFADALGMDTDLAIKVSKRIDLQTQENELLLEFPGTREGNLDKFLIYGVPCTNFGFKSANVPKQGTPVAQGGGKRSGPTNSGPPVMGGWSPLNNK